MTFKSYRKNTLSSKHNEDEIRMSVSIGKNISFHLLLGTEIAKKTGFTIGTPADIQWGEDDDQGFLKLIKVETGPKIRQSGHRVIFNTSRVPPWVEAFSAVKVEIDEQDEYGLIFKLPPPNAAQKDPPFRQRKTLRLPSDDQP